MSLLVLSVNEATGMATLSACDGTPHATVPTAWLPPPAAVPGEWVSLATATPLVHNAALSHANRQVLGLPDELALAVFAALDPPSLAAAAAVSRAWRRVASDSLMWAARTAAAFGPTYATIAAARGATGKHAYAVRAAAAHTWACGPPESVAYLDPCGSAVEIGAAAWARAAGDGVYRPGLVSPHAAMGAAVAVTPDGMVVTGGWDGSVAQYALGRKDGCATLAALGVTQHGGAHINALAATAGLLAIGSSTNSGNTLTVLDRATAAPLHNLSAAAAGGHPAAVWDAAFAPDSSSILLSSGQDCRVLVWDLRTPAAPVATLAAATRPVVALAAATGHLVFAAAEEQTNHGYDLRAAAAPVATFELGGRATYVGVDAARGDVVYGYVGTHGDTAGDVLAPAAASADAPAQIGHLAHFARSGGVYEPGSVFGACRGAPHGIVVDATKVVYCAHGDVVVAARNAPAAGNSLAIGAVRRFDDVGANSVLGLAVTDELLITVGEWIDTARPQPAFRSNVVVRRIISA